jgi:hypothetical protein
MQGEPVTIQELGANHLCNEAYCVSHADNSGLYNYPTRTNHFSNSTATNTNEDKAIHTAKSNIGNAWV